MKNKTKTEEIYSNWIKDSNIKNLTGNQQKVAKMLIDNRAQLFNIGGFYKVSISIIKYLKNNRDKIED